MSEFDSRQRRKVFCYLSENDMKMEENDDESTAADESSTVDRDAGIKSRTREGLGLGERSVTINLTRVSDRDREEARRWLPVYEEHAVHRPVTRGDCVGGQRPCPWISCVYNNYLDEKQTGPTSGRALILNFPDLEPHEVPPEQSCALDIADQGGATLEEVALITNLTRERIRQVQDKAISKLRRLSKDDMGLGAFADGDEKPNTLRVGRSRAPRKQEPEIEKDESENDADLTLGDGDSIAFLSEHPKADRILTAKLWRIYMRESIENEFSVRKPSRREMKGLKPLPPLPDGEPLRDLKKFDADD